MISADKYRRREKGEINMKSITVKTLCLLLVTLLAISTFAFLPVFSHTALNRTYLSGGGLGSATMWIFKEDNNYTSSKPVDLKTGTTFSVDVRVNALKVASWQVELKYNKLYLNATSAAYAADMLFPSGTYSPISPSFADYDGTYAYVLMTATTTGAVEYNGTNKGLITVTFAILTDPDGPSGVDWCWLRLMHTTDAPPETAFFGTWTSDNALNDNALTLRDGYYENRYVPPPPAYLEISPTVKEMPALEGDNIVGTPAALFSVDINIKGVQSSDELFLAQLTLSYNATLLKGIWIDEGTFMNDAAWAPYGTIDNSTIVDPDMMTYYVMIAPNATGYWDNTAWPSGDGLLATARFEVILQGLDSDGMAPKELFGSSALTLSGVFGEFFLGHPNKEPEPDYLPYSAPVDGSVDIYCYYWKLPVADFTWTPLNPLPATIANFDASASYGYKNVGGVLIADPTAIVEYKWNWGDGKPDDVVFGPLMTHIFDAMGLYTVTLTVKDYNGMTDPESKVINVVFGRLIDVFTQYGPPFGGQGQNMPSDMFWPQKPVILTAILTYNGDPVQHKPVAFQVISPTGYWNFTRVVFSDSDGIAIMTFGLPWPCDYAEDLVFGEWTVVVKADIQCQPVEDLLWFKVYWYTHNMTVTPKETEYHKTETAEFDIDFYSCSSQVRAVLVTLVVFDDLDVPVGQASVWLNVGNNSLVYCTFDHYHTTLSVYLPKYAYVGLGKVYVNTFFLWPIDCGYALSPEASAEFFLLKPP
jgi:PKD repeat protein